MEIDHTDHTGHDHDKYTVIYTPGPAPKTCNGCGQELTPVTIYLHPEQKEALEWLIKDRKKSANTIIEHFTTLEHGKRQRSAAKRVRKPKA